MTITHEFFDASYNEYSKTINKKSYSHGSDNYEIYNYDKSYVTDNDFDKIGKYRSVITYYKNIVALAPIKSVSYDCFKSDNFDLESNYSVTANEVVEGTMINLFYSQVTNSWEIATKSAVGGRYWYFRTQYEGTGDYTKQLTFRQMFIEALGENKDTELNDATALKHMDKGFIYSFVLQHPLNHIVLAIQQPTLYLVNGFKVDHETNIVTQYNPQEIKESAFEHDTVGTMPILLPREIDISGKTMDEIGVMANDHMVGIMVHNACTGQRVKLMNGAYERLKDIRGNNPNIHYHYLSLFASGKVEEFLGEFPMYKRLFYKFYRQSYDFIKEIHDAYVSYYVKKMGKTVRINKSIFTHIYTLHNTYYIPTVDSETPTIVTREVVAKYYNAMSPKEKLYHVSYRTREYKKEISDDDNVSDSSNDHIITATY